MPSEMPVTARMIILSLLMAGVCFGQTHFKVTHNTGANMTVLAPLAVNPTVNGSILLSGDEIGAFTPTGLCVGACMWTGSGNSYLAVWGDDRMGDTSDGMVAGDTIKYRVWQASTSTEAPATVTYDHSQYSGGPTYATDAIAVLASLTASLSGPVHPSHLISQTENLSIGPNPMRNTLAIRFELLQRDRVTIGMYSLKGVLVETIMNEIRDPGACNFIWNKHDHIPSGSYLIRLIIGGKIRETMIKII